EDHVRDHVEHVVEPAAAIPGGEPDGCADQPGDPAADDADKERRAQTMNELAEDVLAKGGRAEPIVARRGLVSRPAELERLVRREHRAEDREHKEEEDDNE